MTTDSAVRHPASFVSAARAKRRGTAFDLRSAGRRRLSVWFLAALLLPPALPSLRAWTQEIYVWQRASGAAVQAALTRFAPQADGFNVLAAEVSWRSGKPVVVRPPVDFAALAKLGRPVGLSLRIGTFGGPFAADDAIAGELAALARTLLAAARDGGLKPHELQVDFDCAETKLSGYREWIVALQRAAGPTPLAFTSLPVWLKHDAEFRALAAAADGFVLQVHSLEKPTSPDTPFTLCDPRRADVWVRQAAALGRPFRVALPTYGYVLAFTRDGKFLGLGAEGPRPAWPRDAQLRTVRTDAPALAEFARGLAAQPPANCTGVLWFRLPVAGDRFNWDAATLEAVLRGETPAAALAVDVAWSAGGLAEITVTNRGTDSAPWPREIELRWPGAEQPVAADGLAGCTLGRDVAGGATLRVNNFSTEHLLRPGQHVKVAWLRFSHELSLSARVAGPL